MLLWLRRGCFASSCVLVIERACSLCRGFLFFRAGQCARDNSSRVSTGLKVKRAEKHETQEKKTHNQTPETKNSKKKNIASHRDVCQVGKRGQQRQGPDATVRVIRGLLSLLAGDRKRHEGKNGASLDGAFEGKRRKPGRRFRRKQNPRLRTEDRAAPGNTFLQTTHEKSQKIPAEFVQRRLATNEVEGAHTLLRDKGFSRRRRSIHVPGDFIAQRDPSLRDRR